MPDDAASDSGPSIENRHLLLVGAGPVSEWPWLVASPRAAIE